VGFASVYGILIQMMLKRHAPRSWHVAPHRNGTQLLVWWEGSSETFAADALQVGYVAKVPLQMKTPARGFSILMADLSRCGVFEFSSTYRSRFHASVPHQGLADTVTLAAGRGCSTSPQAHQSSNDTPIQQYCAHPSRSNWRSRRLRLYLHSLFTDVLQFGVADSHLGYQNIGCNRMPGFINIGYCSVSRQRPSRWVNSAPVFSIN
ncbi:MAG: hypothetical protein R6V38_06895, partial [Roseovarius gahaiensis]